jgi:opacity protein-like surface antigen
MKRASLLVALLLPAIMQSHAQVPSINPFSIGIHGGIAVLNFPDPLKQVYGTGYGGGVHVDISLPVLFAIRLSGDYTSFGIDADKYKSLLPATFGGAVSDFSVDGGRVAILSFTANGKYSPLPLPIVSPYLTAGVGTATISISDLTVKQGATTLAGFPSPPSQTKFLINVGAGVDLNLVAVKLFAEARYAWILTDGSTTGYLPVVVGINF